MEIRDRIKELRRVKASELRANPQNWRRHPDSQRSAMQGVLNEIGYADALIARETDSGLELIDGHLRAETTPDQDVPVLVLDLDEAEAAKMLATFDPLTAMAERDEEAMQSLLSEVETDSEAIQEMLDSLIEEPESDIGITEDEDEDEAPEPPTKPVTQRGDVWLCGEHRVMCGDATDAGAVEALMRGERVGLCFTSPPYMQQRHYTEESKGKLEDWTGLMCGVFGNLAMTDNGQVLVNLGLVHRDGEWIPYWDDWIAWMRGRGWRRFGWYVWDQGSGLPGDWNGRFGPSHEWLFHFNTQGVRPEKWTEKQPENIKPRRYGSSSLRKADGTMAAFVNPAASGQPTKVPDSVVRIGRQAGSTGHPAQFPVALPTAVILSWPRDVYDPFLGSGTTLIAAEKLGRNCYGMEISPQYCDVICKRYMRLTGETPVRESDGAKFTDREFQDA